MENGVRHMPNSFSELVFFSVLFLSVILSRNSVLNERVTQIHILILTELRMEKECMPNNNNWAENTEHSLVSQTKQQKLNSQVNWLNGENIIKMSIFLIYCHSVPSNFWFLVAIQRSKMQLKSFNNLWKRIFISQGKKPQNWFRSRIIILCELFFFLSLHCIGWVVGKISFFYAKCEMRKL